MATVTQENRQRGIRSARQPARPDFPFTTRLPDGRTLLISIPGRWTTYDKAYGIALLPEAVRLIDRACALASDLDEARTGPSPGYLMTLREALGLTQEELGERMGVAAMTVSRWERGTIRPGPESLAALERLRRGAVRRGV